MSIRILHVAEAAGGVERYLSSLIKYSGSVENILLCSQNYDLSKFEPYCSKVIQIKMAHDIDFDLDKKTIKSIRANIKRLKPDIVYAHSSKAGALTRLAAINLGIPVIYNPHGWAFNMRQSKLKSFTYKMIERVQVPFTRKIICISESEKKSALKNRICKDNKLQVINNGIDFKDIDQKPSITREQLGISKDTFVVGQIGRLSEQKSPDIFVKMAVKVKKVIPNSFFIMVGDGDLKGQIIQEIKDEGLEDSFLITGWVDNPTSYLAVMDVATLLSRWEGFGLALAEYMYAGVPLVATNVDAIPSIVENGVTGMLVPKDSPQDIADTVVKLSNDKALKAKLIDNARKVVRNKYNIQRVAMQTINVYQHISNKRGV